jgi:hypothetical protein
MKNAFQIQEVNGGQVMVLECGDMKFCLPKSQSADYSLAQIDDFRHLPRRKFPHGPSVTLCLEAQVSDQTAAGTWGFGLWNDPFSMGVGAGGMSRALPVLPNATWFFYGSGENGLSFREDLPGSGFHVKSFRSPLFPSLLSIFGLPALPFLRWPPAVRILRRLARVFIKEDGVRLSHDVTEWHTYRLSWKALQVDFYVDDAAVFNTSISPQGRLGLVVWMDNQYFCVDVNGKLGFGFVPVVKAQWMKTRNIRIL